MKKTLIYGSIMAAISLCPLIPTVSHAEAHNDPLYQPPYQPPYQPLHQLLYRLPYQVLSNISPNPTILHLNADADKDTNADKATTATTENLNNEESQTIIKNKTKKNKQKNNGGKASSKTKDCHLKNDKNDEEEDNPVGEHSTIFLEYAISLKKSNKMIYQGTVVIPDNIDYSLGARADSDQYNTQKLVRKSQTSQLEAKKTLQNQGWTLQINGTQEKATRNIVSNIVLEAVVQFNPLAPPLTTKKDNKKNSEKDKKQSYHPTEPNNLENFLNGEKAVPAFYKPTPTQFMPSAQPTLNEKSETPQPLPPLPPLFSLNAEDGTILVGPEGSLISSRIGTQRMTRAIAQKLGSRGMINDGELELSIQVVSAKPIPKGLQFKKEINISACHNNDNDNDNDNDDDATTKDFENKEK